MKKVKHTSVLKLSNDTNYLGHNEIKMNHEKRGSLMYRFTVSHKKHPLVLDLKKKAAKHNAHARKFALKHNWELGNWNSLMRVRLMPRGPRVKHALADGHNRRYYDQYLPHKHAEYFDVYYADDGHNTWLFNAKVRIKKSMDKIVELQEENQDEIQDLLDQIELDSDTIRSYIK